MENFILTSLHSILTLHQTQILQKNGSINIFQICFEGGVEMSWEKRNVLVNVSQNHRYYSWDLNSSSRIREQEEGLFQHWQRLSVFSFSCPIPYCLRTPDKTHMDLGRSNLSMLRWDSNCLIEWLIFFYTLVLLWDTSLWSGISGAIPVFSSKPLWMMD